MSTKYVRELLESVDPLNPVLVHERIGEALEELRTIEAARAKDAELIQMLVNALEFERMSLVSCMESKKALDAAAAAGFKPSEQ